MPGQPLEFLGETGFKEQPDDQNIFHLVQDPEMKPKLGKQDVYVLY